MPKESTALRAKLAPDIIETLPPERTLLTVQVFGELFNNIFSKRSSGMSPAAL